jgi:predicted PurR-regulated permease PerM
MGGTIADPAETFSVTRSSFLNAAVIAFLVYPLVRALQELRLRRGVGVAVVSLTSRLQ